MMDLPMRAIQRLHCLDDLTASTVSRASPTPGSLIREVMASSSTNAEKIPGSLNIGGRLTETMDELDLLQSCKAARGSYGPACGDCRLRRDGRGLQYDAGINRQHADGLPAKTSHRRQRRAKYR